MGPIAKRGLIAVLVLAVGATAWALVGRSGKSKKDEITYETGAVTRGDIRSFVTATGTIQPWKVVDVKSNVGGTIDHFGPADPRNANGPKIDLGTHLHRDQLIAVIDPTDTQAALDQANADYQSDL